MGAFDRMKLTKFYMGVGAAWLVLWIVHSFLSYPRTFVPHAINECWLFPYILAVNFIFFEYGLPLLRRRKSSIYLNILAGIFFIALHLALVSFGLYGWKYLGTQLNIYTSLRQTVLIPGGAYDQVIEEALYYGASGIASTVFFGVARLMYTNFDLRQAAQQLRLEKQEAELNYLKSQTNPHFLFNTLNNIYSLAKDKSDLAPESILRLSKILRFMLYKTGAEFISAEEELEIISDYIALEKLRYDESLRIGFNFEIEDKKQLLPPLLLIPLVENAFKHGISETGNAPFVDIRFSVKLHQLTFVVKNSAEKPEGDDIVKENIGLSNLRRQLELLYSEYSLSARQAESVFTAELKINLASHV